MEQVKGAAEDALDILELRTRWDLVDWRSSGSFLLRPMQKLDEACEMGTQPDDAMDRV